jgi:hypothetical protein
MGANSTQAKGVVLFFVGFTLIAAGFAADVNIAAVSAGVACVVASVALFLKCKPWEHQQEE